MNLDKLKKANQIYESLAEKTIDEAMHQLNTYDDIDQEVLKLVRHLITNSHQPSAYFEQKVSQKYQTILNKNWQAGDQVGHYELLELIGEGGMSLVFKAQRIDSQTQKPVAIKLFNLAHQNAELKARFQAEQNILAELSHPNVIDFHHGEHTTDGEVFIVMELIDGGRPLDEYVHHHKLTSKQTVALIIQATEALQYAHNHLVIHRDIKPSNIMVSESGQLKVLDFGIAKLINPNTSLQTETNDTLMALTPSFASPEQINAQRIDITTDVFSLAAVAVFLLTGEQPFPANRMLKSCQQDEAYVKNLLNRHVTDSDLRNILLQALHQDPNRRYNNMFAFGEDLSAWLAQKPVKASRDSWWYRLNRFAVRRTALFTTSLVLCLTVIAAILALSMQNQAIKLEAKKADAVKQFMLDSFSVTDPNVSQGVDLSTRDLLRLAANKMAVDSDMDSAIKFELYMALAIANGRLGYYPEAIALLNDALQLQANDEHATALLAQYLFNAGELETVNKLLLETQEDRFRSTADRTAIKRVRANILAQAGKHQQALAVFNLLINTSDTETIKNQALLAEIYYLNGDATRSIEIIEQLKTNFPLPKTDVFKLGLDSDLVQYYDQVGDFSAATKLTEENILTYREILGNEHPDLGLAYNSLSAFQRLNGQLDEALASAEVSQQIFLKRYGDSSEGLAQALSNMGVAYYYQQHNEPAIEHLTQAANMLSDIFGDEHPETITAKANLAVILNATGESAKALQILQKIYTIELNTIGKVHRSTLQTQRSLALTLAKLGQFESAIKHAKENIQLLNIHYPELAYNINNAHSVMGRIYYMAGQYQLSIDHNLIHLQNSTEGNENNFARSLQQVAQCYAALNRHEQANDYFLQWTNKLAQIYGETDIKHLEGLLEWVEQSQLTDQHTQATQLISQVQSILTENDLNLADVQAKIQALSR